MSDTEYTPTLEEIRGAYVIRSEVTESIAALRGAAFNRWLAAYTAGVEARVREEERVKHEKMHATLADMAEHGTRFDLNPTVDSRLGAAAYIAYIARIDQAVRDRAAAAIRGGSHE